jgi:hypothetical protein
MEAEFVARRMSLIATGGGDNGAFAAYSIRSSSLTKPSRTSLRQLPG